MKNKTAQSTIEFTFAMVAVALLIFSLVKTFRWVGMDYAQSAYLQEQSNIFVHNDKCEQRGDCFSLNAENNTRGQRLGAFTRKY